MIKLFDVDARLGRPTTPFHAATYAEDYRADQLISEMSRLSIDKALVRHIVSKEADAILGNELLLKEIADCPQLLPCVTLLPDQAATDAQAEQLVSMWVDRGARAITLYPATHGFAFRPWCIGPLMGAIQDRELPLLIEHAEASADDLHETLSVFPQIPVILHTVSYRANRMLYPLLASHPRLSLSISPLYSVHLGLEEVAHRVGHERLVFGTGWPEREGGASITYLTYSGLSEEEKKDVGHQTLESLFRLSSSGRGDHRGVGQGGAA